MEVLSNPMCSARLLYSLKNPLGSFWDISPNTRVTCGSSARVVNMAFILALTSQYFTKEREERVRVKSSREILKKFAASL